MLSDTGRRAPGLRRKALAVRTYRRIAEILVERGSTAMTPALVARICREAEMKIVHALRADPVLAEQGRAGEARGDRATHPKDRTSRVLKPDWSQS